MARSGLVSSESSSFLNKERALNDLLYVTKNANITGPTSNRQVTLNSAAAVEITPTAGVNEMHIFNGLSVTVRYGGSGVTTSTGGKIFPEGTFAIKVNSNTSIYLIPESGGAASIDIVEFS